MIYGHKATLKKRSVSCRPGGTKKDHPGGRDFFFFSKYFCLVYFRDHPANNGKNRLKIGRKMTEILIHFKKKKKGKKMRPGRGVK